MTALAIQSDDLFGSLFGENQHKMYVDEIPDTASEGNAMMADGMYDIITNRIGRFVTPSKGNRTAIPYLKNNGKVMFRMDLPKIPKRFLTGMYNFFKKIAETNRNEVMVQIFWNKAESKYEMHVPEQEVAGASISFDRSKGPMADDNLFWVMDVHSHVYMSNFFSGTDSADEISARIFGVIGRLDQEGLHMCVRAGKGGSFVDLQVEDVFDMSDTEVYEVPAEDYLKVRERVFAISKGKIITSGKTYESSYYDAYPYDQYTNYGGDSKNSWKNYNETGKTGFRVGYYGSDITNKLTGVCEKDFEKTPITTLLGAIGNVLRAKWILNDKFGKPGDNVEEQVIGLLVSRILIDTFNDNQSMLSEILERASGSATEQLFARLAEQPSEEYLAALEDVSEGLVAAGNAISKKIEDVLVKQ